MPIPRYDALTLPLLRHCATKPWVMRVFVARIADDRNLNAEERQQEIPSGET
jgi:hypothetical protein